MPSRIALPSRVVDRAALGAGDDPAATELLLQPVVGLGRQVVGDVEAPQFGELRRRAAWLGSWRLSSGKSWRRSGAQKFVDGAVRLVDRESV